MESLDPIQEYFQETTNNHLESMEGDSKNTFINTTLLQKHRQLYWIVWLSRLIEFLHPLLLIFFSMEFHCISVV